MKYKEDKKKVGGASMKRTYQPKKRQEQKEHGFMKRMKTCNGSTVFCWRKSKSKSTIILYPVD